jgi:nucleotide-binding universal stress UspA family protein
MYRSILVPLDGSPFGEHALPLALGIARRAGAELQLLHVHQPVIVAYAEGPLLIGDELDAQIKRQQRAYLDGVVRRLAAASSSVPARPVLLEGEIVPTLRGLVSSTGVDLIVMTTHGRGPLARFWLGSVADELVRDSSVPLLLVRPGDHPADLADEPVLKHFLLPLDGSPLAEQIIEPAVTLAALMDADCTLLRVIKPVLPVRYEISGSSMGQMAESVIQQIDQIQQQLQKEAQDYLDLVVRGRLSNRSLRARTHLATDHHPAAAILQESKALGIDCIALETHGRRGLPRLFLGSVADKVIRGSSVPVLVHRPVFA